MLTKAGVLAHVAPTSEFAWMLFCEPNSMKDKIAQALKRFYTKILGAHCSSITVGSFVLYENPFEWHSL